MHARLIAVNGIANVIIPIRDDNVSIAVYDILPNPNSCSAMIVRNRKMAIEVHTEIRINAKLCEK